MEEQSNDKKKGLVEKDSSFKTIGTVFWFVIFGGSILIVLSEVGWGTVLGILFVPLIWVWERISEFGFFRCFIFLFLFCFLVRFHHLCARVENIERRLDEISR